MTPDHALHSPDLTWRPLLQPPPSWGARAAQRASPAELPELREATRVSTLNSCHSLRFSGVEESHRTLHVTKGGIKRFGGGSDLDLS